MNEIIYTFDNFNWKNLCIENSKSNHNALKLVTKYDTIQLQTRLKWH